MEQERWSLEHFFQLPWDQNTAQVTQGAIQQFEQVLTQKQGLLAPAKWELAHRTMQQIKDKMNILNQFKGGEYLWLSYGETWALSIALQLRLQYLDTLPPTPQQKEESGYCVFFQQCCAELLDVYKKGREQTDQPQS